MLLVVSRSMLAVLLPDFLYTGRINMQRKGVVPIEKSRWTQQVSLSGMIES